MTSLETTYVGGGTYSFRWDGKHLDYLGADRGPVLTGESADVDVTIGLYRTGPRMLCGEIKVATVLDTENATLRDYQRLNTLGDAEDPLHLDSALWRALPIGQLIESAVTGVRQTAARIFEDIGVEYLGEVARAELTRRRPGPRPSLTPEILARVVAPAFAAGGRKSVEAVREALQEAGYPGSGPRGDVTIDQARKAVTKARAAELIEPARRRTPRREERAT